MPEVRQSSFALLGDLTKACFHHVKPCIGTSNGFIMKGSVKLRNILDHGIVITSYCWLCFNWKYQIYRHAQSKKNLLYGI
jgi:hypothetical protein